MELAHVWTDPTIRIGDDSFGNATTTPFLKQTAILIQIRKVSGVCVVLLQP